MLVAHERGEVEHVLATQTLPQERPKWMSVTVDGELQPGVTAKDVILAILGEIGTPVGSATSSSTAGQPFERSRWKAA